MKSDILTFSSRAVKETRFLALQGTTILNVEQGILIGKFLLSKPVGVEYIENYVIVTSSICMTRTFTTMSSLYMRRGHATRHLAEFKSRLKIVKSSVCIYT